mmetsp:Transcript_37247/g.49008  ORF Transcript_37247/g.49008 Transcript_37247/m.49008 type:complete len:94 (-) Transcript_37247:550-831(-)|eukprot:CAMPEP_0170457004 /NCGR_PEP_ID=MMETSP0123-20130129/4438_1 /TAXON_ID=182087 /ORGANISM="Favella ehrenbergii, Strain Fehren 1" /LENGTH=93 /DNA_ID=CAMNT_0010720647 /DNA_START=483 /DNA_END=764 /DNA_ORIENTATION=+
MALDGILGLWAANATNASYDRTQMLVPELVKSTAITRNAFSWYMVRDTGRSYVDFGAPNTSAMSDASALVNLPIKSNSYYWSTDITGFKWSGS